MWLLKLKLKLKLKPKDVRPLQRKVLAAKTKQ